MPIPKSACFLLSLSVLSFGLLLGADRDPLAQDRLAIHKLLTESTTLLKTEEGVQSFLRNKAHPDDLKTLEKRGLKLDQLAQIMWKQARTRKELIAKMNEAGKPAGYVFYLDNTVCAFEDAKSPFEKDLVLSKTKGRWHVHMAPHPDHHASA